MDTSDPDIFFNDLGHCNHCVTYINLSNERPEYSYSEFEDLIKRIKKRGKKYQYDCLVGISGGIDSSYLLHTLRNSGLRILAMHYDSGWNSKEAVHNLRVLTEKMGIKLVKYQVNWEEFKALQIAYLKAGVVDLDVPTDHALQGSLYKVAADYNVPFILTGHNLQTESIMPKSWVTDKLDSVNLRAIYKRFGSKVRLNTFPLQALRTKFLNYNLRKIEMIFIMQIR